MGLVFRRRGARVVPRAGSRGRENKNRRELERELATNTVAEADARERRSRPKGRTSAASKTGRRGPQHGGKIQMRESEKI